MPDLARRLARLEGRSPETTCTCPVDCVVTYRLPEQSDEVWLAALSPQARHELQRHCPVHGFATRLVRVEYVSSEVTRAAL